ncbi:MAG TPA: hypothetical protein PKY40_16585, partial [Burkholderiaceae bacterium]|nr:hypothetical protein [Burkholderiaceae bacterium]
MSAAATVLIRVAETSSPGPLMTLSAARGFSSKRRDVESAVEVVVVFDDGAIAAWRGLGSAGDESPAPQPCRRRTTDTARVAARQRKGSNHDRMPYCANSGA